MARIDRKMKCRRCFWRDQSGQAIVFGVLTFFMLVLAVAVVYNVGAVVARRIQLQQAADAAATAGAQIEANAVSSIAWMNDGMAYIYYNICRYAVDVGVYGTFAELKETGPPFPSDEIVGVFGAVRKYDEAYSRANTWIPRGEKMLDQISKMEYAIALATPVLVEMEAYSVAAENGADRSSIFPKFVMFPDPDSYFLLNIRKIPGGWEMISDRGDEIIVQSTGDESWWISATQDGRTVEMSIDKLDEDLFRIIYTDEQGTKIIYIQRTPYGDIIVEGNNSVKITQNDDGSTTVTQNGKSVTYRTTDDGTIEVKRGGVWVPIEKEETVGVDGGPQVRVDNFTNLQVGSDTWVGPNSVWIYDIHITLTDPVAISGHIGLAHIGVNGNNVTVNGLSTANADGKWRMRWTSYGDSGEDDRQLQDRTRHRMTELVEDEEWEYEWARTGSYLLPDNRLRFSEHAVRDNDEFFIENGTYPPWSTWYADMEGRRGWFNMETGRPRNWSDYYQIRECWNCGGTGAIVELDGRILRCPLCLAIDHDGDGESDIMVTQWDSLDRAGNPRFDSNGIDRQSVNTGNFGMPLVLTEEFFKFGINVGVWSDTIGIAGSLISNPDWGLFALSSAKVGFIDPETEEFTMRFPTIEDREIWVNESPQNLYEPGWEFRMVSSRDAILGEDIDVIEENETGANYLYRGVARSHWRDGYYGSIDRGVAGKMYNMTSPWGRRFDITARELEDAIRH